MMTYHYTDASLPFTSDYGSTTIDAERVIARGHRECLGAVADPEWVYNRERRQFRNIGAFRATGFPSSRTDEPLVHDSCQRWVDALDAHLRLLADQLAERLPRSAVNSCDLRTIAELADVVDEMRYAIATRGCADSSPVRDPEEPLAVGAL